jgi:hypothetical protein
MLKSKQQLNANVVILSMKICSKCKIKKGLSDFYKNKIREDGLHGQCKDCMNAAYKPKTKEQANRDAKNYAKRHPQRKKETFRNWYYNNKESYLPLNYERRKIPEAKAKSEKWRKENKEKLNELRRIRRKNMTPKQKAEKIVRDRFYKVIVRMKKGKKFTSSLVILGCSIEHFMSHIETQFLPGMSWSNHGNGAGKWNIDHITPLIKYDLTKLEEQKEAFHYANMRPLWFDDNMKRKRKHYKVD